ncbi:MAG: hypothetical protein AABX59_00170 [Nanoarchaeota archaeon]
MPNENVVLSGFSQIDKSELDMINKIVDTYIKKYEEISSFKSLKIHLKSVKKKTLHIPLNLVDIKLEIGNKQLASTADHRNLYSAINIALERLYAEATHEHELHKEKWKEFRHKVFRRSKS